MKIMLPTVNERITDQIAELCEHYGWTAEEVVLSAIQTDYIRMLDFKKTEAEEAVHASWLEPNTVNPDSDDEIPY